MEATAATQEFIYKADNDTDAQRVPSIAGYAVLLPTILSVMYGQGEWPENSVSDRYGGNHCLLLTNTCLFGHFAVDKQLATNTYPGISVLLSAVDMHDRFISCCRAVLALDAFVVHKLHDVTIFEPCKTKSRCCECWCMP